jgi:hypothetical protein
VARRKGDKKVSVVGAIILAGVLGAAIGAFIFHDSGTPPPSPDDIEFKDPYDDALGKIDQPAPRGTVSQIFIRIDDKRTEEEAKKKIEQLWHRLRNATWEKTKWHELQDAYNEESDKRKVYPFPGGPAELLETAKTTKVGFARIIKSAKGYHLVRRES